jgi:hypothetical protein
MLTEDARKEDSAPMSGPMQARLKWFADKDKFTCGQSIQFVMQGRIVDMIVTGWDEKAGYEAVSNGAPRKMEG